MNDVEAHEATRWMLRQQRRGAWLLAGVGVLAIGAAVVFFVLAQLEDPDTFWGHRVMVRERLGGMCFALVGVALAIAGAIRIAKVRRATRELDPGLPSAVVRSRRR